MKKLLFSFIVLLSSSILFAQDKMIFSQDFESAVDGNELLGNFQVKNFNAAGGSAWTYDIATGGTAISGSNSAHLNIQNSGDQWWGLQFKVEDAALTTVVTGKSYNITFKIKSSTANNKFEFHVQGQSAFVKDVTVTAANVTEVVSIDTSPMTGSGVANFLWAFGKNANVGDIWIDDIVITELAVAVIPVDPPTVLVSVFSEDFENATVGPNNIGNTEAFNYGASNGTTSAWNFGLETIYPITGAKSAYLNVSNTGTEWWNLQYKIDSKFPVTAGLKYKVTFKIQSKLATKVTFKVQALQDFTQELNLKGGYETETFSIIVNRMDGSGGNANFIWGFGNPGVPTEVWIDDIVIEEMQLVPLSVIERSIDKVKIWSAANEIIIDSPERGAATVYSITGQKILSTTYTSGRTSLPIANNTFVLVQLKAANGASKTVKVLMK
jgi:hypothetical protein